MIEISKIIKEQLEYHNMTQATLAKLMNVSPKTVSHWTTGRSEPDLNTLAEICTIFQISLDETLKSGTPISNGMLLVDKNEIAMIKQLRKLSKKNRGYFAQLAILVLKISGDNSE